MILAFAISSCSDNEQTQELKIDKECNTDGSLCSFELINATISRTTTLLGKEIIKVVKKEPLTSIQGTFVWLATNGNEATTAELESNGFRGCAGAICTNSENPTGFTFAVAGDNPVSISGTVIINGVETSLASVPAVDVNTSEPVASGDVVIINVPDNIYRANINGSGTTIISKGGQNSISITCPTGYSIYPVSSKGTYEYSAVQNSIFVKNDSGLSEGQIWSTFVRLNETDGSISKFDNPMFGSVGSRAISAESIVSQHQGQILDFYCLGPNGVTWSA